MNHMLVGLQKDRPFHWAKKPKDWAHLVIHYCLTIPHAHLQSDLKRGHTFMIILKS